MRRQDEEAFRVFMTARLPSLLRTAYLLCGDHHQAEDIVAAATVKLYTGWRKVDRARSPGGYARQVVVRTWIDGQRRAWRREQPTAELPDQAEQVSTADAVVERAELRRLLDQLPARQRAVLVLRFYDDLTVEDTASALRISADAVKKLTQRALRNVRAGLPAATELKEA